MVVDILELEEILRPGVPEFEENLLIGYANMKGLHKGDLENFEYCIVIGKKLENNIINKILEELGLLDQLSFTLE